MWLKTAFLIVWTKSHPLHLYLHIPSTLSLMAVHWLVGISCALGMAVLVDVDAPGVGVGEDVDGPGVGVGEDRQGSLGMGAELVPITCLPGEAAAMVVTSLGPTIATSKRGPNTLNRCLATASCTIANPSSCIFNPSICFAMPCLNNLIPSTVFHHSSSSISSVPANSPNILPASPHSSNSWSTPSSSPLLSTSISSGCKRCKDDVN